MSLAFSLCCCSLLWSSGFVSAADSEAAGPPAVSERSTATVRFEALGQDWGSVRRGCVVERVFTFHNDGSKPLRLLRVKSSCGCTTVDFDRVVEPGGVGSVTLGIDTRKLSPGPTSKYATVSTNDPSRGKVRLTMSGDVVGLVKTLPKKIELIGPMSRDKSIRVTILAATDDAIFVEGLATKGRRLDLGEIRTLEAGRVYEIEIAAAAVDRAARFRDDLTVTFRDSLGKQHSRRLPVMVHHQDRYVLSPSGSIIFRRAQTQKLAADVQVGVSVRVPFGNRRLSGVITKVETSRTSGGISLRPVEKILDP